jgi:hypothetical protein
VAYCAVKLWPDAFSAGRVAVWNRLERLRVMAGETWRDDERPGSPGELPAAPGRLSGSRARTQQTGRPAPTVRDTSDPQQRGESPHTLLHLPGALSGHWHIESELLSRGTEVDLLLVADSAGERRVAKIYRAGIEPKTDVLERVGGTSFEHVVLSKCVNQVSAWFTGRRS